MEKIDFKKLEKHLYRPSKVKIATVEVPQMNFLMIDGRGDPNTSQEFQDAIQTLYPVSYNLKFKSKREMGIDYGVLPLEGLWWAENMDDFLAGDKSNWSWTLMIRQPDHLPRDAVQASIEEVRAKKDPPALSKVRFEAFKEGLSVQIMHLGSFDAEGPTIARMHEFIEVEGYQPNGHHHEIYLSDFTRTAPEKLRTVLRQPIRKQ
jgi:hypothetical protein